MPGIDKMIPGFLFCIMEVMRNVFKRTEMKRILCKCFHFDCKKHFFSVNVCFFCCIVFNK